MFGLAHGGSFARTLKHSQWRCLAGAQAGEQVDPIYGISAAFAVATGVAMLWSIHLGRCQGIGNKDEISMGMNRHVAEIDSRKTVARALARQNLVVNH